MKVQPEWGITITKVSNGYIVDYSVEGKVAHEKFITPFIQEALQLVQDACTDHIAEAA